MRYNFNMSVLTAEIKINIIQYLNVILMAFSVKLLRSLLEELRCPC